MAKSTPGALRKLDQDAAIKEIASGVTARDIAARFGCTPQAVRLKLKAHPGYKQAVDEQAEALVEAALVTLRDCERDNLAIAHARAWYDACLKWASKRNPKDWGDTVHVDVTVDIGAELAQIAQAMRHAAPHTIDNEQSTLIEHTQVPDK